MYTIPKALPSLFSPSNTIRLEMNLGIIAASIAPLRPLFVNLDPMIRIASDINQGPHASDRPFLRRPKVARLGHKQMGIPLESVGERGTIDCDVVQGLEDVPDCRV